MLRIDCPNSLLQLFFDKGAQYKCQWILVPGIHWHLCKDCCSLMALSSMPEPELGCPNMIRPRRPCCPKSRYSKGPMKGVDQMTNSQSIVPRGVCSSSKTKTVSIIWPITGINTITKNNKELAKQPRFPDIKISSKGSAKPSIESVEPSGKGARFNAIFFIQFTVYFTDEGLCVLHKNGVLLSGR